VMNEVRSVANPYAAADYGAANPNADEVPITWNPNTGVPVAANPGVSGAGARRNVGGSAYENSDAGCLGRRCGQTQSAYQHRCR
jgi:hypothetical protein